MKNLHLQMLALFLSFQSFSHSVDAAEYRVPTLLSDASQNLSYVCQNSSQRFAAVIWKTHRCDNLPKKQCMELTRTVSDPCNTSLSKLSLFHFRLGRYTNFESETYQPIPSGEDVAAVWSRHLKDHNLPVMPGMILIDTKSCKIIEHVFLYQFKFDTDRYSNSADLNQRIAQALSSADPEFEKAMSQPDFIQCSDANAEVDLREIWEQMEAQ